MGRNCFRSSPAYTGEMKTGVVSKPFIVLTIGFLVLAAVMLGLSPTFPDAAGWIGFGASFAIALALICSVAAFTAKLGGQPTPEDDEWMNAIK